MASEDLRESSDDVGMVIATLDCGRSGCAGLRLHEDEDGVNCSCGRSIGVGRREHRRWTHDVQNDVSDFHRVVVGIEDPDTIAIRRPELRAELIREEARETVEAIERGDLVEAIDGMCDLLCVVYGTAAEFGVDLAPFWAEVHRSNMAKAGGPVREDGKRLKPPGWTPPDIAGVLAKETDRG